MLRGQYDKPKGDKQRVGIYGGSFDPVHTGHMVLAMDAVEQLQLDRLHLIPAATNPFKQDVQMTDGKHRLAMLKLATAGLDQLIVDDRELRRGGVSYAIDTVLDLQADYPECDLYFLIGDDNLEKLGEWHRYAELSQIVTFTSFPRGAGSEVPRDSEIPSIGRLIDISSTEVRLKISRGHPVNFLVPEPVRTYILDNKLYLNHES